MAHLKHSGPVRQAAHAKRTALVEILTDEAAANDGDLSEQDLLEIDLSFEAIKASDCATFGQRAADLATAAELARDPRGGFVHG